MRDAVEKDVIFIGDSAIRFTEQKLQAVTEVTEQPPCNITSESSFQLM